VFWGIGTGFSKTGIESSGGICTAVRESSGASVAKVAAHAAAGGTLNVLQGGKFGHGFLSAGVTEALSPAIGAASSGGGASGVIGGTVASAVVGGTVSELSGGKFGNGAATGAFQFLFNKSVHELRRANDSAAEDERILAQRKSIIEAALSMEGDESYSLTSKKGSFGSGKWKCNLFVYDVLLNSGVSAPTTEGGWPIVANSWGNSKARILGWDVVSVPMPGDIAAIPRSEGSGHVGIYIDNNWGSDVMAANETGVGWSPSHHRNEWFNWAANASGNTVYRRWVGATKK